MFYKKILLVDDSATSRMIIKRCFTIAGFKDSEFFEAKDGLDALNFFEEENSVDLVVTDLNMPKMDGNNLIKKLRINEGTRNIPVVIISSMGDEFNDKQLDDLKIVGIIKKPISPSKVIELLGE